MLEEVTTLIPGSVCLSHEKLMVGSHSPLLSICAQLAEPETNTTTCSEALNSRNGRDGAHSIGYLIFIGQLSSNSPTCIFLLTPHTPFAMRNFQFGSRYSELHQCAWHNSMTCCLPRAVVFKL